MRALQMWRSGVLILALAGALGCSGSKDAGHPANEPATAPTETKPEPTTAPSAEPTPAPATTPPAETTPSAQTTPPAADCAGICYRNLPKGGCESMPTCCPKTVHLKVPPHCPADYTLDLNSGPEKCAVNHLCVD